MEGNIIQLKEYHLNKGTSKDHTPVFPRTKASAIEGMAELLKDLKISGVTPANDISDVNSPEKGKIYYEESTDKYYVYSEDKSSFVELGAGASVEPSDLMPTITQEASTQSGGDNIITFTFPNGETTQVVIKNGAQGEQGNSGVASADEVVVVNNLTEGGTTVTDGGVTKVKVLSAEMGKKLAEQTIIKSGTFAQAYNKAVSRNVPFQWLLQDKDKNNNDITKMIWHIGNREFVDSIGTRVDWAKGNVIIKSNAKVLGFVLAESGGVYQSQASKRKPIIIEQGTNIFTFDDLRVNQNYEYGKVYSIAFKQWDSSYDSYTLEQLNALDVSNLSRDTTEITFVDYGDLEVNYLPDFYQHTGIERLYCKNYNGTGSGLNTACYNADNLIEIELGGTVSGIPNTCEVTKNCDNLEIINYKNLHASIISSSGNSKLSVMDIRNINPKDVTTQFGTGDIWYGIKVGELIIGDFDTSNVTADVSTLAHNGSITTLVCTSLTPPATNPNGYILDKLLNKAGVIKIPASSEVAYRAASVWSTYISKMETYEEGEY